MQLNETEEMSEGKYTGPGLWAEFRRVSRPVVGVPEGERREKGWAPKNILRNNGSKFDGL